MGALPGVLVEADRDPSGYSPQESRSSAAEPP
jgi:hypothetical protein